MDAASFFEHITAQFDEVLPFVAYRKPNETELHSFFQEDVTLHISKDFSESGFVFAPFDATQSRAILIPSEQSASCEFKVTAAIGIPKGASVTATSAQVQLHLDLVQKGITYITSSEVRKIVLSRKQNIPHAHEHPISIFRRLLNTYQTAFVYCWYHPKVGLWLGATPETLLAIKNRRLQTMALAGTQPYAGKLDVPWGTKEKEEQQYVTDAIVDHLRPLTGDIAISEVQTHRAGELLHLKTEISASFKAAEVSLATIINALHPTPAVCGLPKGLAKQFILNNEGYDRSYYTGFLGELNLKREEKRARTRKNVENLAYGSVKKESHLFVNLRCMEIDAAGAQIYVGGGITKDSDPQSEWEETVNKLTTMLRVLE